MDLGPAESSTGGSKALIPSTPPSTPTCEGPALSDSSSRVTTLIHVRVAKFRFLCDLGQAIGRFTFVADTITSRLRLVPRESKNLSMGVKKLELVGQGRAGGSVAGEGLLFETRLRNDGKATKASDLVSKLFSSPSLAADPSSFAAACADRSRQGQGFRRV